MPLEYPTQINLKSLKFEILYPDRTSALKKIKITGLQFQIVISSFLLNVFPLSSFKSSLLFITFT